ncbi:hypothetical protein [Gallaecimonas pentaromativorans]|uniref:Flagellin n=2 Tax=Gallaecimonas pentaromativorans TaxID=584787 RepID=A0A3N1P3F2_9GAMM|nr:hypothetical protein [Gallaecimonas pentaromativorans]MED5526544.1 hypothetical protein [Pseudomonadota bacterium]ROQ25882.1 hypothetical protein EDC28_105193 [Gallaecimonas pentaromativorans]
MAMQISALNSKDTRPQTLGVAAGSGYDEAQAPAKVQNRDSGGEIGVKVQRHGQWALMSQAQSRLSMLQSMEQSIVSTYRQLVNLARQLDQNGGQSQALANQARALAHQVKSDGWLDGELSPNSKQGQSHYLMNRVDLLSPRNQGETVRIGLPGGNHLSLKLGAQASQSRALAELAPQFARLGITASLSGQGKLQLTGPEALFSSPWTFQGQGIRVPAGNPIPIGLDAQPQVLEQLADGLEGTNLDYEKARLRALLVALEQHRKALQAQRQQLMARMEALRSAAQLASQDPDALGSEIKSYIKGGDFGAQLQALMAQANLSRQSVVSLLSL